MEDIIGYVPPIRTSIIRTNVMDPKVIKALYIV